MSTRTVQAAVTRGAKLLDKHVPGWTRKIDTSALDLGEHQYCILGQLYGLYFSGITQLSEVLDGVRGIYYDDLHKMGCGQIDPIKYGFEYPFTDSLNTELWEDTSECYSRLTELWLKEIQKRKRTGRRS